MENIVLTVHLLLAVALIALVLLQRSEGGGLGMGGGGGGVMTGRQAANALTRVTWILAIAFLATSLTLTVMAARNVSTGSVIDQLNIGGSAPATDSTMPALPGYTPPPAGSPIVPGAPAPATAPTTAPATAPTTSAPAAVETAPAETPAAAPATPAPADPAPAETPAADSTPAAPATQN